MTKVKGIVLRTWQEQREGLNIPPRNPHRAYKAALLRADPDTLLDPALLDFDPDKEYTVTENFDPDRPLGTVRLRLEDGRVVAEGDIILLDRSRPLFALASGREFGGDATTRQTALGVAICAENVDGGLPPFHREEK